MFLLQGCWYAKPSEYSVLNYLTSVPPGRGAMAIFSPSLCPRSRGYNDHLPSCHDQIPLENGKFPRAIYDSHYCDCPITCKSHLNREMLLNQARYLLCVEHNFDDRVGAISCIILGILE